MGRSRCGARKSFRRWRRRACATCGLERFGFFPPFAANAAWGPPVERVLERRRILQPVLPFQLFGGVRPAE